MYLLMCVFYLSGATGRTKKYIALEAGGLCQKAKLLCVFIPSTWNRWEKCWIFKICLAKHSTCALKWSSIRAAVYFTSLMLLSSWSKTNSFWNSHHDEHMWVIQLCVNESHSQARPHSLSYLKYISWWDFSGHSQALSEKILEFFMSVILYIFDSSSWTTAYKIFL